MRPVFRLDPKLPVTAMKTYQLSAPLATHFRRATCAEVQCPPYLKGWATTVFRGSADEALIRRAGRRFLEEPAAGGMVRFVFPAGQPCFKAATHRAPLEREPLYVVRGGDWRGNPRGDRRVHARPEHWVDDFATHQDQLNTRLQQG